MSLKSSWTNFEYCYKYDRFERAPHLKIKYQIEGIQGKLLELVSELEKEENEIQSRHFLERANELLYIMGKEYKKSERAFEKMKKPKASIKSETEYETSVNDLVSQVVGGFNSTEVLKYWT